MSKIGVGVGDEFPVDDGAPKGDAPAAPNATPPEEADRAEFEAWKRRRDAWRAQKAAMRAVHDEWKQRRREWKEQWKAQRRVWRDEGRCRPFEYGPSDDGHGPHAYRHGPWRFVAAVAIGGLIVVAFSHVAMFLAGMVALAALIYAYHSHHRHEYDPFDLGPYDAPRSAPPPASPAA